MHIVAARV
ncbi:hypothetical protein FG05_35073 [Fusarium graminearum]|nr:hypothetical protein FG05_35073 [Fusarium graminearum]